MFSQLGRLLIVVLILVSLWLRSPPLFILDALVLLVLGATALWGRYCLAGVSYARRFGMQRLFCGEDTDLWVEVANAKPLPLAWLSASDEFPADVSLSRVELSRASDVHRRMLTNVFSLRWYQRVRRHYRLRVNRRGVYDFGPVVLSSGDLFGFRTRYLDLDYRQSLLVYPKLVALEDLALRPARPLGDFATPRRLLFDPLRLSGTRAYQPGDDVRHIHWKATARQRALQTKVLDPSASEHLILFLNSQTLEHAYEGVLSDRLETAIVVAAAVAHAALEAGHPVGLFTNGSVRASQYRVRLPASRHRGQTVRILETLAQLSHISFLKFEDLLRLEIPHLAYGASVLAVSPLANEAIYSALLDLRAAGHPTALAVIGDHAVDEAPAQLPVYLVTKNWTELEALQLD